jgi:hypothetical protein
MFMKKTFFAGLILFAFLFFSCRSNNQNSAVSTTDTARTTSPLDNVPVYRTEVKKEPVAEYKQKINNSLNDWYFSVKVYETQKTLNYLIKMQYEEVTGDDTLKLPNLGTILKPVIQPGKDKYSCVIGFMDLQNKFEDCKIVSVEDGNLKLTAIKHYYGALYRK